MHIVAEILCYLAVLIVGQSQLIVLRAIDDTLLDGSVNLTEAHWRGCCTKGFHHIYAGRALLHTDF